MQYIHLTPQGQINLRAKHPSLPETPPTRQFQARLAFTVAKPAQILKVLPSGAYLLRFKGVSGEYEVPAADTVSASFVDIRPDIGRQITFKDLKRNVIALIPQTPEGTKIALLAEETSTTDELATTLAQSPSVSPQIWRFMLLACIKSS